MNKREIEKRVEVDVDKFKWKTEMKEIKLAKTKTTEKRDKNNCNWNKIFEKNNGENKTKQN